MVDLYARNYSLYFPKEGHRTFVCPLSTEMFRYSDIREIEDRICLAHIYPESVGGKDVVVASASADNEMGRRYEHHLKLEENLAQWNGSEGPIPGKILVDGKHMGVVSTKGSKGNWHFRAIKKQTDPAAIQKFRQAAKEFQFKFLLPNPRSLNMALLKSAFLTMFRTFGYEYALSVGGREVRNLWMNHDLENLALKNAVVTQTDGFRVDPYQVTVTTVADKLRCFGVFLPTPSGDYRTRCVLLPGFDACDWAAYFHSLSEATGEAKIRCLPVPCPEITALGDKGWKFAGHWWWGRASRDD